VKKIPLWIVASMGKKVALEREFVGPCETYLAGCEGRLTSIQVSEETGDFYVTVALDANDPSYLENFAFDAIRPASRQITFSLDIEEGFIAF